MGVSAEVWQARIGSFNRACLESVPHNAVSAAMPFLLITILLLIGCIESNPGPGQISCSFCAMTFKNVSSYAKHQEVHATRKKFTFPCCECGEAMITVNAFNVHFSRFHRNMRTPSSAPGRNNMFSEVLHDVTFQCSMPTCQVKCRTARLLKQHITAHLRTGHVVLCPYQPCVNRFSKVSTFRTHLSQYHRAEEVAENVEDPDSYAEVREGRIYFGSDNDDSDAHADFQDALDEPDNGDQQHPEAFEASANKDENIYPDNLVRDHLVKFYLLLEGELLLPSSKVQRISEEIALLCRISHHQIAKALRSEMVKENLDKERADFLIDSALKRDIVFNTHHKNLDVLDLTTEHLRSKAYEQRCAFLPFQSILLGTNDEGKKKYASFIKIKDTLLHMFNDKSVQRQIDASFNRQPEEGIYSDFTDGSTFNQHPICSIMDSIQLILFQDAFEFFPLSVSSGLYKCVGFYFMLGNMSPENRSKVDAIQLSFLVTEPDLKFFTPETCLKKLIDELKDLAENGIQYKDRILPVVLMHLCGDNLGQNFIGRYTECFTSDYSCRFCEMVKGIIRKEPYATLPLRTVQDYEDAASLVNPEDPRSCIKGIKGNSPFNNIPTFHVANPGQPPCAGHDILEGIAKKDYALYLRYFVEIRKWFSIEDVNKRISNFRPKGRDAADGIAKLDPKLEKIRGHASEVWLFIRMLPFLIADKIQDKDDPVWKLCIELKVICEYIFAPKISKVQVAKLKELLNLYVEKRASIFNKKLQPKHHFVCHYPELITYFGVLIRLWALRFESRHVFFKKAAKAANNFINITTTLAYKYVLNFAYKMSNHLTSSTVVFSAKDAVTVILEDMAPSVRNLVRAASGFDKILKCVSIRGIDYTPGLWVLTGSEGNDLIVGEIVLILKKSAKDIKFILKICEAVNTFQGYYIINMGQSQFCTKKLEELQDYYPLPSYQFQGNPCLTREPFHVSGVDLFQILGYSRPLW